MLQALKLTARQYQLSHTDDSFETAMPTPSAAGRSPRGGSLCCSLPPSLPLSLSPFVLGPACPVGGGLRDDVEHPNLSDRASSGSRSREGSGKPLRHVYYQEELGTLCLYYYSCAASDKRHGNASSLVSSGKLG